MERCFSWATVNNQQYFKPEILELLNERLIPISDFSDSQLP